MKNDYLLDLAEVFGRNLGKALTDHEEDGEVVVIENLSDKDMIMIILKKMLYSRKYTDGEDFLFTVAEESLNNLKEDFIKKSTITNINDNILGSSLDFKKAESNHININNIDIADLKILGQWFYEELSKKSEEDLNENNFSSLEVTTGLKDYMNLFTKY